MPKIKYSIRIMKINGRPAKGKRVAVHYQTTFHSRYADKDGWVYFLKETMFSSTVSAKVYIEGDLIDSISIKDGSSFSFTI